MGGKEILALGGETAADLKSLEIGDVIFATPEQWDNISRKWKQRVTVQSVELFICDDIHLLGSEIGPTMEIIVSRSRYISNQTDHKCRIVILGASLANARDVGDWIGANSQNCFNFHPSVRPVPLEIHIQGYNITHHASLMMAMAKPTFTAIENLAGAEPAIIFVPSRKQTKVTATELLTFCAALNLPKRYLHCSDQELAPFLEKFDDPALAENVQYGVAFYNEGLTKNDKKLVESLFRQGAIQIIVANQTLVWSMQITCKLVVVMGCQYYEGKEHRYVDYPIHDILQMMGRAVNTTGEAAKCVLMCTSTKKEYLKKFLHGPLPIESGLNTHLHDHFNAEIVTKTIENKQDAVDYLTWTFMYRRMAQNPMYYVISN